MRQVSIGIVLVNYKTSNHTIECIKSLRQIEFDNFQIIVVDNFSQDDSVEKIKAADKDVILIESKENLGFAGGNRLGIQCALSHQCDYVLMLNNDTIVEKDFLREMVKHTQKEQEKIAITTCKILYYDDRKRICYAGGKLNDYKGDATTRGFCKYDEQQYNKKEYQTFASGCCMLIPRWVFELGLFMNEEYFLYYEDVEYCKRLIEKKFKILYVPSAVIYHKESVSTNKASYNYSFYFARNRLTYISSQIKGIKKAIAYLYTTAWLVKKVLLKQLDYKGVISGVKEYMNGK